MDGPTALAAIRQAAEAAGRAAPPAVAVTANVMPQQLARYAAQGFAGHLPKPLRLDRVAEVLLSVLATEALTTAGG
jgi:CheY-like chemotaxis protein